MTITGGSGWWVRWQWGEFEPKSETTRKIPASNILTKITINKAKTQKRKEKPLLNTSSIKLRKIHTGWYG